MMSDLRESGAIEQDADLIMFIYRDEVYNPSIEYRGSAEVIVAKQRNGQGGTLPFSFMGDVMSFSEVVAEGHYEGYPQGEIA